MTDEIPKDWLEQARKQRASDPRLVAEDCFRDLAQQFNREVALAAFEAVTNKVRLTHPHTKTASAITDAVLLRQMLQGVGVPEFAVVARQIEPNKDRQDAMRRNLHRIWDDYIAYVKSLVADPGDV